ncbi:hypothetical protein LEP1GSC041_2807 [Leptospira noguchii str. 2006001870]|nr:hypothetical protein LEP1GSC041_2807 [Leptospira noguchii str. 2006001870]
MGTNTKSEILQLDFENVGTLTNPNYKKQMFKNSECNLICGN